MAFFPRNFHYPNEVSFATSFCHALNELNRQSAPRHVPQWEPKFDIRETAEAYELHGELPGINKDDVHIEFSEPHTLAVRGRSERTYTAGTSPTAERAATPLTPPTPDTVSEAEERRSSHQATVENEDEAAERESGYEVVATDNEKKPEQKPADKAKYWLTERSIGEFYRSFKFPSRVEQDAVTASFKDGILSVYVPKAKKHEVRRISIH